jgi:hypothetical protein
MIWIPDSELSQPIKLKGIDGKEIGLLQLYDDSQSTDYSFAVIRNPTDADSGQPLSSSSSSRYSFASFQLIFWNRPSPEKVWEDPQLSFDSFTKGTQDNWEATIRCPSPESRFPSLFVATSLTFSRSSLIKPGLNFVLDSSFETADAHVRFSYQLEVTSDFYLVSVRPDQDGFPSCPVIFVLRFSGPKGIYDAHCRASFGSSACELMRVFRKSVRFYLKNENGIQFSIAAHEFMRPILFLEKQKGLIRPVFLNNMAAGRVVVQRAIRLPPHPNCHLGPRGFITMTFDHAVGSLCVELRLRRRYECREITEEDITPVCQEFVIRITGKHGSVTKTGFGYISTVRSALLQFSLADLSAFDIVKPRSPLKGGNRPKDGDPPPSKTDDPDDERKHFVWVDGWFPPPPEISRIVPPSFTRYEGPWMREVLCCLIPVFLRIHDNNHFFLPSVERILERFVNAPHAVSPVDIACCAALQYLEPPALASAGEFGFLIKSFLREDVIKQCEVDGLDKVNFLNSLPFIIVTFTRSIVSLTEVDGFYPGLVVFRDPTTDTMRLTADIEPRSDELFRHVVFIDRKFPAKEDSVEREFWLWPIRRTNKEEEDELDSLPEYPDAIEYRRALPCHPSRYGFVEMFNLASNGQTKHFVNFLRVPLVYPYKEGKMLYTPARVLNLASCRTFIGSIKGKTNPMVVLHPSPFNKSTINWEKKPIYSVREVKSENVEQHEPHPEDLPLRDPGIGRCQGYLGPGVVCSDITYFGSMSGYSWFVTILGIYRGKLIPATNGFPILIFKSSSEWQPVREAIKNLCLMEHNNFKGLEGHEITIRNELLFVKGIPIPQLTTDQSKGTAVRVARIVVSFDSTGGEWGISPVPAVFTPPTIL